MARRLDRPVAVCTLAVSLAALGAASLPGTARADESTGEPFASVPALTDVVASTTAGKLGRYRLRFVPRAAGRQTLVHGDVSNVD